MTKRTILTEKPDVAKHVAEFFGIEKRLPGAYLLKNGDWVTNNVGHLLGIGVPEDYMSEAQKAARGFGQLPVLPPEFRHFADKEKADQLRTVVRLTTEEQRVFDAVARRYMAQFYPKHKYVENKLEAEYGQDVFASGWRKTLVDGWKVVDQQADEDVKDAESLDNKPTMKMRNK
ncbi:TPA: hypothetical protein QDA90_005874 [Burkholderia vietnamiensis]|uniref:hypothetical protein n=1 Tax=Burkholderia vietnamiensis TaxID=60552 RepID=UPI00298B60D0|nr:hypothetical protein [Burkholderia vietnamiensis]